MTPLQKLIALNNKQLLELYNDINDELRDRLGDVNINDVSDAVQGAFDSLGVTDKLKGIMYNGASSAFALAVTGDFVGFAKFYENSIGVDGSKLSSKINDLSKVDDIVDSVRQAMRVENSWFNLTRDLERNEVIQGDFPQYMQDLVQVSRKASLVTDDIESNKEYARALRAANRNIEALADTDSSTLAQAYRNVVTLSKKASGEVLDKAINRAVMFKARKNAMRTLNTEMARVYGNARIYDIQNDNNATGIQWTLSEQHDHYCECDFFAEADMFGMGAGVYPVGQVPEYPAHPWCACELDPVYDTPAGEYNDEAGKQHFDGLDEEDQASLVGKDGTWDDMDWSDHVVPENMKQAVDDAN